MKRLFTFCIVFLLFFSSKAQNREIDLMLIQAAYNDSLPLLKQLLDDSADVNAVTDQGVTPLMYAAQNGDSAMVELLIKYGANVNLRPDDGFTALISSCLFNHLEPSITLIENGADINAQNMYGATPLMIAAAYGYYIMTDMLLYYGANTEINDIYGNTALNIAAAHGYEDIVSLLLSKGAFIETKDLYGFTPLMSSVMRNNKNVLNVLVQNKADINAQDNKGYTPLMIAIQARNDSLIKILAAQPFNKELKNNFNQNAADVALLNKNRCLFQCLQSNRKTNYLLPFFKSLTLSSAVSTSINDVIFANSLGIADSKYGIHIFTGFATRIGKKKILALQDNNYYQFNEKRSFVFTGISKDFIIKYNADMEMGINTGFYGAYSYESIEGTAYNLPNKYLIVPSLGVYHTFDFLTLKCNYEYIDFKTYKVSPHRLMISLNIDINFRKNPKHTKSIDWVN